MRRRILGRGRSGSDMPTDGLIAYWNFNEESGNTLIDYSGNNFHGVNNNCLINQEGKLGKAYQFNGFNSSVDLQANILGGLSAFTFGFWIKPGVPTGTVNIVYGQWDTPRVIVRNTTSGVLTMVLQTNEMQRALNCGWQPNHDFFYLILFEYDGINLTGYSNNSQLQSISCTGVIASSIQPERWGNERNNYGNHLIDEGFAYNRVLTTQERSKIWNNGNGITYQQIN